MNEEFLQAQVQLRCPVGVVSVVSCLALWRAVSIRAISNPNSTRCIKELWMMGPLAASAPAEVVGVGFMAKIESESQVATVAGSSQPGQGIRFRE